MIHLRDRMQGKNTFVKAVCAAAVLIVPAIAGCSNGGSSQVGTPCGNSPSLGQHRGTIESLVDFQVVLPKYLPTGTYPVPEPTVNLPDEIVILFRPCPNTVSSVVGPAIIIEETTQSASLPEPGESDPPTERIQIGGLSALMQQEGPEGMMIGWQQGGLSLFANFMWESRDGPLPEMTAEMKAEAIRVVESMMEQGREAESGP